MRKIFTKTSSILIIILGLSLLWLSYNKFNGKQILGLNQESAEAFTINYIRDCVKKAKSYTECFEPTANAITSKYSIDEALNALDSAQKEKDIYPLCHVITHFIGRKAYAENSSIPELYSKDRSACNGGFYHGVMEQHFKVNGVLLFSSDDQSIKLIRNVCRKKSDYDRPIVYLACVHGLGHALMFVTDYELPKSLKFCEVLETNDAKTCFGGVFMENAASVTNPSHPVKYLKKDDLLYPCNVLHNKYANVCYSYHASYFGVLTNWDWQKIGDLCYSIPNKYRSGCFVRLGGDIADQVQDKFKARDYCNMVSRQRDKYFCYQGFISAFGSRNLDQTAKLLDVCSIFEGKSKARCYITAGKLFRTWDINEERNLTRCNQVGFSKYINSCKIGVLNGEEYKPEPAENQKESVLDELLPFIKEQLFPKNTGLL